MHTAHQLDRCQFTVSYDDAPATREDLLPGWGPLDRLGVVVKEPFDAVRGLPGDLPAARRPARTVARSDEAVDGIVLAQQRRDAMRGEDGSVTETYRSIPVDEALEMLA